MKKLLVLSLLLLSTGAIAQSGQARGCRVLIGEDWIPMGATTVGSCLKYAEAAATPGDRQFAQFDGVQLSYKDGQSSQSTDGGKTWQPVRSSQGSVGALNTLRAGSEEGSPAAPKAISPSTEKSISARQPSPQRAADSGAGNSMMPDLEAPIPLDDSAPTLPAGSRDAQMAPAAPVRRYRPQPSATASAPGPVETGAGLADLEADTSSIPRGCQVHIGNNWQVTPVTSAAACGRVLISAAEKSGAKSSQAYWAGTYLFYSSNKLFRSTDGNSWTRLK